MANPNIVNVSSILGKTQGGAVTTSLGTYLTNSSGSNAIYKINSLIVSNVDGTDAADITAVVRLDGADVKLASTVTVPADATLVVISKDTSIYLEEGDSIKLQSNANGDLQYVLSYEIIS